MYPIFQTAIRTKWLLQAVIFSSVPRNSQRASTFILNVLLQRAMLSGAENISTLSDTPESTDRTTSALEEYGAAAITLKLISSTALFLAREPFRVALARSRSAPLEDDHGGPAKDKEAYRRRFVNTAWVSAPVGLAFTMVVWLAYPWIIKNDAFHGVRENRQVRKERSNELPLIIKIKLCSLQGIRKLTCVV